MGSGHRDDVLPRRARRFSRSRLLAAVVVAGMVALAAPGSVSPAGAVAPAAFTTIGPAPYNNCFSGSGLVNCNIYNSKDDVWINGGPSGAAFADGNYFFAVTTPNGDPNDASSTLLSTDPRSARTFAVSAGVITYTGGTHLTSGSKIQLSPYNDTDNPGGEYKVHLCSDDGLGGTVTSDQCKTDNFKVHNGGSTCQVNCNPSPFGTISGEKYFDVNHNGQLDPGEVGISNWPVDFTDGVANTILTDNAGQFSVNLPPDTYTFAEEHPTSTAWTQTGNIVDQTSSSGTGESATLNGDKTYSVVTVDGGATSGIDFGNVCTITNTGGLTLGFWSNNNGQKILQANDPAWRTVVDSTLYVVSANGNRFAVDLPTATFTKAVGQLRTWLLNATSTNASYMLSAQMLTTEFDRLYAGLTNYYVQDPVVGDWVTIDTLITRASAFVQANPNTKAAGTARNQAVAYQTLFNAINNSQATVTPPGPGGCPTPTF
jgi:hypothetical protein